MTNPAHQGSASLWPFASAVRATPPDGSELGIVLKAYRAAHHLNQYELAELLHIDQSYVSMLENGRRHLRDVDELRRIAAVLDLPESELGLLPIEDNAYPRRPHGFTDPMSPKDVLASQRRWRDARRVLNRNRPRLARAASLLYPDVEHPVDVLLLSRKDWMPTVPVEMDRIALAWRADVGPPTLNGSEAAAERVRPLAARGGSHPRYSQAMRLVDRPGLFVNRPSYRLLDLSWQNGSGGRMEFGYTSYYEMVDVCEAVAHEMAQAWDSAGQTDAWLAAPETEPLGFRSLIGDPFDLARRAVLPSINTLTLRRSADGAASFVLHRREAANVAIAGGTLHVMPAGVFQPSSTLPWHQANDFDLLRNMYREFAEEFLGDPEADGESGEPIDYASTEPYRSLEIARHAGALRAWCLGVGLDPLTLTGEILAVVVMEAVVYDEVFAAMVTRNAEGDLAGDDPEHPERGVAFTAERIERLRASGMLAPAADACLALSWHHRDLILAAR